MSAVYQFSLRNVQMFLSGYSRVNPQRHFLFIKKKYPVPVQHCLLKWIMPKWNKALSQEVITLHFTLFRITMAKLQFLSPIVSLSFLSLSPLPNAYTTGPEFPGPFLSPHIITSSKSYKHNTLLTVGTVLQ